MSAFWSGRIIILTVGNTFEPERLVEKRNDSFVVPFAKVTDEREFGQFRGRIHMDEGFDDPLPDDFWLGRSSS